MTEATVQGTAAAAEKVAVWMAGRFTPGMSMDELLAAARAEVRGQGFTADAADLVVSLAGRMLAMAASR